MIHSIKELGTATYLLNDTVKIQLDEDLSVTAEYDETVLTEKEVETMIDSFFLTVENAIKRKIEEEKEQADKTE